MEKIQTKHDLKDKLIVAESLGDAMDIFKNTTLRVVTDFMFALEHAEQYIELTMRDQFFLNQAKLYYEQVATMHGVLALSHKEETIDALLRTKL